jgi:4-oxalocrotonate tautomerase
MPHVIVKMIAGKSEAQKRRLTEEITKSVMANTDNTADAVSVSIEDIAAEEWTEKVYKIDILPEMDKLFKKPGYDPLK